ncbi:MAG: gluconokinase [Acidobacteriota bacterium]
MPPTEERAPTIRIVVLMGVSGCGKTTVGTRLARALDWAFLDGDDFHPPENVRKMAAGTPLDDEDRWPWLRAIRAEIDRRVAADQPAVIACSALKAAYREVLGRGASLRWVHLHGTFEQIAERLGRRQGHFMPPELLRSQFETLEAPDEAFVVDVQHPPDTLVDQIVHQFWPDDVRI